MVDLVDLTVNIENQRPLLPLMNDRFNGPKTVDRTVSHKSQGSLRGAWQTHRNLSIVPFMCQGLDHGVVKMYVLLHLRCKQQATTWIQ